ncbi:MAG TPA: O-antigen ligase family protein [Pyrinomonadaceae bacterium]|nr:O-antigen ligase family protein [Pyrinomonadaceae bacterium]
MKSRLRRILREPLLLPATLWPLILFSPHIPGLPRPSTGGLPWRQELLLALLLSLTLGLKALRARREARPAADSRPNFPVLFAALFAAWAWASTLWAAQPAAAAHQAFQWSAYAVFFALLTRAASAPRVVRAAFVSLCAAVWVLGLACALESWLGAPLTDGNIRSDLKPILRGSGGFGEIMAVSVFLFAAPALYLRRARRALLCGATSALALLATLQSLERAPFVGFLAGLLPVAVLIVFKKNCRPRSAARAFALLAALLCVTLTQALPLPREQQPDAPAPLTTISRLQGRPGEESNTHVRFLFWGVALEMLRAHPLLGVGANNYAVHFAEARAHFAERHPDSALLGLNENFLAVYAHNEYVQTAAELGAPGLLLFVLFAAALVFAFARALGERRATGLAQRRSAGFAQRRGAGFALCAAGGMLAFAVSSGASASSFRYLGGGLVFFFAASIVNSVSRRVNDEAGATRTFSTSAAFPSRAKKLLPGRAADLLASRAAPLLPLALMALMVCDCSARAWAVVLHGRAQATAERERADSLYRASLRWDASSAAAHFDYGVRLAAEGRAAEALPHLRYGVANGLNTSVCFARLAAVEEASGDLEAAERTLAFAARAYPRSVFARVRHAAALARVGKSDEAELEMAAALLIDSRRARGWQQLIERDIDPAVEAARRDSRIAMPGELAPQEGVFAVLDENERRFPEAAGTGWRARMRSHILQ